MLFPHKPLQMAHATPCVLIHTPQANALTHYLTCSSPLCALPPKMGYAGSFSSKIQTSFAASCRIL